MSQRQGNGRRNLLICSVTLVPADRLPFAWLMLLRHQFSRPEKTFQKKHGQDQQPHGRKEESHPKYK
jgi:hypothetical protein